MIYRAALAGALLVTFLKAHPVKEISLLYSVWTMTEASNTALGNKTDEQYQSIYLKVTTRRWKKAALQVQLPYMRVQQTLVGGAQYYRSGPADLELTIDWNHRWLTAALTTGVPLGYDYAASGVDHLWLGSASVYLKSLVRVSTWYTRFKTGAGLEGRYRHYLQDGAVGWGSREGGIKGYVVRQVKKVGAGAVLDFAWKSMSYYTTGILAATGLPGEGYGEPETAYDLTGGLFVSGSPVKRVNAAGGISLSLYQKNAGPGISGWMQLSYTLPNKK